MHTSLVFAIAQLGVFTKAFWHSLEKLCDHMQLVYTRVVSQGYSNSLQRQIGGWMVPSGHKKKPLLHEGGWGEWRVTTI